MLTGSEAVLAVTYIREDEAHGDDRVYAQLLMPDGTWSTEILVNSDEEDTHPANPRILAVPQGGFLVIWNEENPDDDDEDDVLARLFGPNLQPLSDPITINASITDDQVHPDAAVLTNGALALVWLHDEDEDEDIYLRIVPAARADAFWFTPLTIVVTLFAFRGYTWLLEKIMT